MKNDKQIYEVPILEVLEIAVEQGFANSGTAEGMGNETGSWG